MKKKTRKKPIRRVKTKSSNMSVPKKRKRTVARSGSRSSASPRKRRRSGGGLAATGKNLWSAAKPVLAGAGGGITYGVASGFVPSSIRPWAALGVGIAAVFVGMNHFGAGMAGAAAYDFTRNTFGLAEMSPTEYVNPTILSDAYELSEYETIDESGNVYALSDSGTEWEYVGTMPMQGVQMSPTYIN